MFINSEELQALAAQGLCLGEIARRLGRPYSRVRRTVQILGIEVVRSSRGRPPANKERSDWSFGPVKTFGKINPADLRLLAAQGLSASEIARRLEVSVAGVSQSAKRHRIDLVKGRGGPAGEFDSRNERMATMYRQGLTLEKIGQTFNLTRERVRQLVERQGVARQDGGISKTARSKQEARQTRLDVKSLIRYGLPHQEMNKWRAAGLVAAYRSQENAAANRGIEWGLNFAQWLDVWLTSGKLEQRGRGKGKYVMSRIKDSGGYLIGNVHVQLATENGREAIQKWKGKQKAVRGVFYLYPGLSRPYMAKVGKKSLGRYATEEEAVAARMAYIQANGYSVTPSGVAVRASHGCEV
jgi:DNA-binding CsgD family transcriptional regulator